MPLSRRGFLGVAATLPASALTRWLEDHRSVRCLPSSRVGCVLLDMERQCVLRESWSGFNAGLASAAVPFRRVVAESLPPAKLVIVPGAVLTAPLATRLRRLADGGSTILYESGAAYAEPGAIQAEQHLLRTCFGFSVGAPLELWPAPPGAGGWPYIHYHWPTQVTIRDFSRALALPGQEAMEIAVLNHISVARRRRIGKGGFIFLGSPLGPHLGYGDPAAHELLHAFLGRPV